jgi:hypothetical protein
LYHFDGFFYLYFVHLTTTGAVLESGTPGEAEVEAGGAGRSAGGWIARSAIMG